MPSFNFKPEFVPDILANKKGGTIRMTQRCKPGQTMFLFTGMRTKKCKRIGTKPCVGVMPIQVTESRFLLLNGVYLGLQDSNDFAKADGFRDLDAFFKFFENQYGLPYSGWWHVWDAKLYERFLRIAFPG